MKTKATPTLFLVSFFAIASGASAQNVPSIAANITKPDGTNVAVYVVGSYEDGIMESRYASGVQAQQFPYSDIASIDWREPDEWRQANDLFTRRKWEEAAAAYNEFFKKYYELRDIEDSFPGIGKFRECECLRRLGKFEELAKEFENLQRANLSERYEIQSKLFNAWGHLGNGLYTPLQLIAESYEIEASDIPAGIVRPSGLPLKELDPPSLMQVSFLRGIAAKELGEKEDKEIQALIAEEDERDAPEIAERSAELKRARTVALNDFARGMTLTFGNEPDVVKDSLLNSLSIIAKDPELPEIDMKKREAYSLAVLYTKLYPGTPLPSEYQDFLTPPAPGKAP
ncbi:MAG: hypothetical protein AAGJ79_13060 [Verrucomicrobiota bacterium]